MQITRQADYAVRCVFYLSQKLNEVTMIDEIAKKMSTPRSFLAKILQRLVKAGVVKSFRGVKGGFQLAKKPSEISLLEVVEAIDGVLGMNICAVDKKRCSLSGTCCIHPVWVDLKKEVEKRLKKKTFAQLIKQINM